MVGSTASKIRAFSQYSFGGAELVAVRSPTLKLCPHLGHLTRRPAGNCSGVLSDAWHDWQIMVGIDQSPGYEESERKDIPVIRNARGRAPLTRNAANQC
jgi:hypothetical protein